MLKFVGRIDGQVTHRVSQNVINIEEIVRGESEIQIL